MLRQFIAAISLAFSAATISDCGKDTSLLQITELALKPDPPIGGQPIDIIIKFNNPGFTIVNGKSTTSITLNFISYPTSSKPLCEATKCPIIMGINDHSTRSIWPDNISGFIKSKILWTSEEDDVLLCIQVNTNFDTAFLIQSDASLIQQDARNEDLNAIEEALRLWGPEHDLESAWEFSEDDYMFLNASMDKRTPETF
jgi:hypothetical protein